MTNLLPLFKAPTDKKLLVVLDLDLTLVHAVQLDRNATPASDCSCIITNQELQAMGYPNAPDQRNIWTRPGFREFLRQLSEFADIIVWTLSQIELARLTLTKLDVDRCIKGVVGRDEYTFRGYSLHNYPSMSTEYKPSEALPRPLLNALTHMNSTVAQPHFLKDLSALGYDMSRTVIVDDWSDLAVFNPTNIVVVEPFDKSNINKDNALLSTILPQLRQLAHPDIDVRQALSNNGVEQELTGRCFAKHPILYSQILATHRLWRTHASSFASLSLSLASREEVKHPVMDESDGPAFNILPTLSEPVGDDSAELSEDDDVAMTDHDAPVLVRQSSNSKRLSHSSNCSVSSDQNSSSSEIDDDSSEEGWPEPLQLTRARSYETSRFGFAPVASNDRFFGNPIENPSDIAAESFDFMITQSE